MATKKIVTKAEANAFWEEITGKPVSEDVIKKMQKYQKSHILAIAPGRQVCVDNIGGIPLRELVEALRLLNIEGLQAKLGEEDDTSNSSIITFGTDGHSYMRGWLNMQFIAPAFADDAVARLGGGLYMMTGASPIPRPLLVHKPQKKIKEVGQSFSATTPCHFVQPNTIEHKPALEWKLITEQLAWAEADAIRDAKTKLCSEMTAFIQKWNINVTPDGRFPEAQLALSSSILWLKFLPLAMKKDQIGAALEQFGVTEFLMLKDPTTGEFNGTVLAKCNCQDRAECLQKRATDSILLFQGSPRPVEVSFAYPGLHVGSQAVYDRALRETFLRSDLVPCEMSLVLINDDGSPLPPEYACAVKLRSILLDLDAELVFLQEHALEKMEKLHDSQLAMFKKNWSATQSLQTAMGGLGINNKTAKKLQQ